MITGEDKVQLQDIAAELEDIMDGQGGGCSERIKAVIDRMAGLTHSDSPKQRALDDAEIAAYVENGGIGCPYFDCPNPDAVAVADHDTEYVFFCEGCKRYFTEVYTLSTVRAG